MNKHVRNSGVVIDLRASLSQNGTQSPDVSCGTFFPNPRDVQRMLPAIWAEFLKSFRSDLEVQLVFGVCEKTVRNWRAEIVAPRGHHLVVAGPAFQRFAAKVLDAA